MSLIVNIVYFLKLCLTRITLSFFIMIQKQQHTINFFSCTDLKSFKTLTRDNGSCYIREPIASQDFDS